MKITLLRIGLYGLLDSSNWVLRQKVNKKKLEWWIKKSLVISLSVLIQYRRVTDGQTDRHVSTAKTALCRASRG